VLRKVTAAIIAALALLPSAAVADVVAMEGDSISVCCSGGIHTGYYQANFPSSNAVGFAVGGSGIDTMQQTTRKNAVIASKPVSGKWIVTVLIGANDLNATWLYATTQDWLNALWLYTNSLRAQGAQVMVATILPQGGAGFNTRRATANAAIRAAVGTHHNGVIDFAADPDMGCDSCYSNTTWYSDGVHPTFGNTVGTGQRKLYDIYAPAVNALLASNVPPIFTTGTEPAAIPSNFDVNSWINCTNCFAPSYSTPSGSDEGAFRTFCEASHLNNDDPLLYPGVQNGSHTHLFFGNTLANYASTYTSLRTTGDSTCGGGPINRSAYWMPAVIKDVSGTLKAVRPAFGTVYYKINRVLINAFAERLPRGFGYVTGFNPTTGLMDNLPGSPHKGFGGWKCETGTRAMFLRNADGTAAFECPSTALLAAEFTSPACWDGVNVTSPNGRSHVSHRTGMGGHTDGCPSSHPYMIPHFDFIVWFSHNGSADYKEWYFSSDRMSGKTQFRNGESGHTDWFGAWDFDIMQTWLNECNGLTGNTEDVRSCVASQIGDGRQLSQGMISFAAVPEASRYMDLPSSMPVQGAEADVANSHLHGLRR
jgi:Domain of unknown function (DUF1996)/GDSL-like Lipase/Acylhydrolase family